MAKYNGFVYIMANSRPTLYTGVTNNIVQRVYIHRNKLVQGFTTKYNLIKLVYYEYFEHIEKAIVREKQLKDMNRNDKLKLIYNFNPSFSDLWNEIVEKYK